MRNLYRNEVGCLPMYVNVYLIGMVNGTPAVRGWETTVERANALEKGKKSVHAEREWSSGQLYLCMFIFENVYFIQIWVFHLSFVLLLHSQAGSYVTQHASDRMGLDFWYAHETPNGSWDKYKGMVVCIYTHWESVFTFDIGFRSH